MDFEVRPLPAAFGREIVGLDIEKDIAPETGKALKDVWLEHGVLVFRGIGTSPEAQLRLSRCFGTLEPHPIPRFRHPDYEELILLSNENRAAAIYEFDGVEITQRIPWHTDLAFMPKPNAGALLRMVQKTKDGGQTGWLETAMAYDELDEAIKEEIADLEAVYLFRPVMEDMRFNKQGGRRVTPLPTDFPRFPPVVNPLVWVHPQNGRKVLNISTLNIDHIRNMDLEVGDRLITRLVEHALQPRFQYIHDWENNDMVLWDNRRTMHSALGHPADQIRIVHRTTIKGDVAMGYTIVEEQEGAAA